MPRIWLTLGIFERYGTPEQVKSILIRLSGETLLQRIIRRSGIERLLAAEGDPIEELQKLILQFSPEIAARKEILKITRGLYKGISQSVLDDLQAAAGKDEDLPAAPQISRRGKPTAYRFEPEELQNRKFVLRRLMRNLFYPLMRQDEETGSQIGMETVESIRSRLYGNSQWVDAVEYAYTYYRDAKQFTPRGIPAEDDRADPLPPYHRYGIWEALQYLQNPQEHCALFTGDASVDNTLMATLAAFNIKDTKGDYAAKRVLYTTSNQSKYEIARMLKKKLDKNLDIKIFVLDREKDPAESALFGPLHTKGNIIVIANYKAARYFSRKLSEFKPDVHIIDEIENLKSAGTGSSTARILYNIPAPYRIGISDRIILKQSRDITEALSWARKQRFPEAPRLRPLTDKKLFSAMYPVSVRWTRDVVLPEIGDPELMTIMVPYNEMQDEHIRMIRENFPRWMRTRARDDIAEKKDHLFTRCDIERNASVDLSLVIDGENLTGRSPKIRRLSRIIKQEQQQNKKVIVVVDSVEEIARLEEYYNKRLGAGSAVGISSLKSLSKRNREIMRFRSEPEPSVLFITSRLLRSCRDLSPLPGAPFRIATIVHLSCPWSILNDGELLLGTGEHPVQVITLISVFRKRLARIRTAFEELTIEQLLDKDLITKRMVLNNFLDGQFLLTGGRGILPAHTELTRQALPSLPDARIFPRTMPETLGSRTCFLDLEKGL